jgi:hypothetical protein
MTFYCLFRSMWYWCFHKCFHCFLFMFHCIFFPTCFWIFGWIDLRKCYLCTLCNCSILSVVLSPSCVILCISTVVIFCKANFFLMICLYLFFYFQSLVTSVT